MKSLDSSRISKSRPLESVPTGNQSYCRRAERVGKGNRGDPVYFVKIEMVHSMAGCFSWAVKDSMRAAILAFYEGLLKLQDL